MKKIFYFLFNIVNEIKRYRLRKSLKLNSTVSLFYNVGVADKEHLVIGDYVHIGENARIHARGGVKIGRGTIFGPNVTIYSSNHRFRNATLLPYDGVYENKPVVIDENVWIGGNVIVVPGTTIGEGAIIGAGAVVSGAVPAGSIVIGNPCKVVGQRNMEEYYQLKKEDKIYLKHKLAKKNG